MRRAGTDLGSRCAMTVNATTLSKGGADELETPTTARRPHNVALQHLAQYALPAAQQDPGALR